MTKLILTVLLVFVGVSIAIGFAATSSEGGIAEAYAALPPSGGVVRLNHDVTITTPQTLTLSVGKPLFLDLNGHTVTCTNNGGACLTIFKPDATPRYPLSIYQGRFIYRGSSPGVVG